MMAQGEDEMSLNKVGVVASGGNKVGASKAALPAPKARQGAYLVWTEDYTTRATPTERILTSVQLVKNTGWNRVPMFVAEKFWSVVPIAIPLCLVEIILNGVKPALLDAVNFWVTAIPFLVLFISLGSDALATSFCHKGAVLRWDSSVDGGNKVKCAKALLDRLDHFTDRFATLPADMCDAFDRLVDVRDKDGAVEKSKRNTLCWQLQGLLTDDDSYEDALTLLHTVAATHNPATTEAARSAVGRLHELRTQERAKAAEEAKAVEEAKRLELASAQPDYSAEVAALLERRRADDAVLAEVAEGR